MPDDASNPPTDAFAVRRDYIPRSDYVDPRIHELEKERLWPRVWQIACREEEVPNVGDYVVYDVVEDSIVVIRTAPDRISAFHNVCPHRGRRLRDDACGSLTTFRCNYHAWRFGLDGKLIDRPSPEDWADHPLTEADTALSPVKVGTWAGMVWINMDPDCEPLADFLGHLTGKLDPFEFEVCRFAAYWTIRVPANWKVVLEAFVEAYHVPGTHPQLMKFGHGHAPAAPEDLAQTRLHATHTTIGGHGPEPGSPYYGADERTIFHARMEELSSTIRAMFLEPTMAAIERVRTEAPADASAAKVGELYAAFHKEELIAYGAPWPERLTRNELWSTEWQIFPNSSVLPTVDGALWYRVRPDGDRADSCIFDIWSLGRFPPGKAPACEPEFFERPEDFKDRSPFLEQDFKNLAAVQKGMKSRGWRGARPSPVQEVGVTNLHRVLHQYLYGDEG